VKVSGRSTKTQVDVEHGDVTALRAEIKVYYRLVINKSIQDGFIGGINEIYFSYFKDCLKMVLMRFYILCINCEITAIKIVNCN